MGIKDPHDPRSFQHFVKFADDGTVAAIVEVADGQPEPDDLHQSVYLNMTDRHPFDMRDVTVDPALVAAAKVSAEPVAERTTPELSEPASPMPVSHTPAPTVSPAVQDARQALKAALVAATQGQK